MNPDMESIELYRQKEADYNARMAGLEAVTAERDEVWGVGRMEMTPPYHSLESISVFRSPPL
jgi:hypothetical protein